MIGDCQNTYLNLLKVISCLNLIQNVLKSLTEKSLTEEEVEKKEEGKKREEKKGRGRRVGKGGKGRKKEEEKDIYINKRIMH